jgi:hypothetical protein
MSSKKFGIEREKIYSAFVHPRMREGKLQRRKVSKDAKALAKPLCFFAYFAPSREQIP